MPSSSRRRRASPSRRIGAARPGNQPAAGRQPGSRATGHAVGHDKRTTHAPCDPDPARLVQTCTCSMLHATSCLPNLDTPTYSHRALRTPVYRCIRAYHHRLPTIAYPSVPLCPDLFVLPRPGRHASRSLGQRRRPWQSAVPLSGLLSRSQPAGRAAQAAQAAQAAKAALAGMEPNREAARVTA